MEFKLSNDVDFYTIGSDFERKMQDVMNFYASMCEVTRGKF